MNEQNTQVAARILATSSALKNGSCTVEEAQAALQTAIPLFENDGSGVADATRDAEVDLERILFVNRRQQHVPLAIARMEALVRFIQLALTVDPEDGEPGD